MKYLKKIFVPVVTLTLASAAALHAQSISVAASEDAWIRSDSTSFGGASDYNGYIGTTTGSSDLRQVFAFDLSGISAPEPGLVIDSVSLTLTQRGPDATSGDTTVNLSLYALTSGFTEGGVNWNTSDGSTAWTGGGDLGNLLSTTSAGTLGTRGTKLTFDSSVAFLSEVNTVVGSGGVLYLDVLANVTDLSSRSLINTYLSEVVGNVGEYVAGYEPTLTLNYSAVPEASVYSLLCGVICLFAVARRRGKFSKSA